jgi:hypothetical protein
MGWRKSARTCELDWLATPRGVSSRMMVLLESECLWLAGGPAVCVGRMECAHAIFFGKNRLVREEGRMSF